MGKPKPRSKREKFSEVVSALKEAERRKRIGRLVSLGLIRDGSEIPEDAIAVDADRLVGGISYPIYWSDIEFVCRDCGARETWTAERQRRYYEDWQKSTYHKPIRCRGCRVRRRREEGSGDREAE